MFAIPVNRDRFAGFDISILLVSMSKLFYLNLILEQICQVILLPDYDCGSRMQILLKNKVRD